MPLLVNWINKWRQLRADYNITLVQPGYSKRRAQSEHLELLAATQAYLMDTYRTSSGLGSTNSRRPPE